MVWTPGTMIGCLLAEGWWWRGRGVGAGVTWEQCVRDDMLLGLHWAIFKDMWRDWGKRLTLASVEKGTFSK